MTVPPLVGDVKIVPPKEYFRTQVEGVFFSSSPSAGNLSLSDFPNLINDFGRRRRRWTIMMMMMIMMMILMAIIDDDAMLSRKSIGPSETNLQYGV